MNQLAIPCLLFRSGTSRGPFFLSGDLPDDHTTRDKIILATMGSPDERQIDGIGGATTLTSKVVIFSPSHHDWADIDFLFGQVSINQNLIDWSPSCGNMTAAVAHAAIKRGLVSALDPITKVKIRNLNTNSLVETVVQTPQSEIMYDGNTSIDGVPGAANSCSYYYVDCVWWYAQFPGINDYSSPNHYRLFTVFNYCWSIVLLFPWLGKINIFRNKLLPGSN